MSARAPVEAGRPPAERPPIVPHATAPGPSPRTVWIAVVALLVGGIVGYLIGGNLGPTETETVTVTEQVTETVAPPAYTAGTEAEAFVAFDGARSTYNGPAEVNAGTQVTFTYAASVADPSLILGMAEPGISYELAARSIDTRSVSEPPRWLADWEQSEPVDARQQTLSMSLVPGTYVVVCAMNPDTSTGDVFMSTMIRVVGS